jgi:hypothetical protein
MAANDVFKGLKGKQRLWLRAYLDETNPDTYLNATGSAMAAKYKAKTYQSFGSIGSENFKKLERRVSEWLENEGLSDNKLKLKMLSLMDAKQIYFQKIKGAVDLASLPPGAAVVAQSMSVSPVDDGETVIAIPVESLETQRRTLDMAIKVKGLYAKDNEQSRPLVMLGERMARANERVSETADE